MSGAIVDPYVPIYLFMIAVWLFTASLLVIAYVLVTRGERWLEALVGWCRRTFTSAGDYLPTEDEVEVAKAANARERRVFEAVTGARLDAHGNVIDLTAARARRDVVTLHVAARQRVM
jgi:hypothetical protein